MMFFSAPAADVAVFSAQGGSAADLQGAANAALVAELTTGFVLYGATLTGAGDGSQWGILFAKSLTVPTPGAGVSYAASGSPLVPAATSFDDGNAFSVLAAQAGTIAEARAQLQLLLAASLGTLIDLQVAGSSNGQQWMAVALISS